MNGTSSSSLMTAYENLHASFAERSVFGKVWALSHTSLAVSFELAYTTLVWASLAAELSNSTAIYTARSVNLLFTHWAKWLEEEEKKAGIQ